MTNPIMITAGMDLYQWLYEHLQKAQRSSFYEFEPATFINWHEGNLRMPTIWRFDHAERLPKWDQPYSYVVMPQ